MLGRQYLVAAGAVLIVAFCACTSRYRLDLYVAEEGKARRVNVEQTQFTPGFVLGEVSAEQQLVPGIGNCLVLMAGTRIKQQGGLKDGALTFDEFTRYRIWVELPSVVQPGTLPLVGKSYVFILGRYEQPIANKLYTASSGSLVIDSVAGGRLYGTFAGEYQNSAERPLSIKGQFRAKVKK